MRRAKPISAKPGKRPSALPARQRRFTQVLNRGGGRRCTFGSSMSSVYRRSHFIARRFPIQVRIAGQEGTEGTSAEGGVAEGERERRQIFRSVGFALVVSHRPPPAERRTAHGSPA